MDEIRKDTKKDLVNVIEVFKSSFEKVNDICIEYGGHAKDLVLIKEDYLKKQQEYEDLIKNSRWIRHKPLLDILSKVLSIFGPAIVFVILLLIISSNERLYKLVINLLEAYRD